MDVGIDIIEIKRIEDALAQHGDTFLNKILTPLEKEYCLSFKNPVASIAGRFSAKEACAKALGTGLGELLAWKDMEISHEPSGRPLLKLSEKAQQYFDFPSLSLSISHCKQYATAIVILTS